MPPAAARASAANAASSWNPGEVAGGLSEQLSQADREKGYRLACRSTITEDVVVRVPVESAVDASVLGQHYVPRRTARIRQMDLNDLKEQGLFLPPVEKVYIELPEPDNQDHLPDVTRLVSHLKLHHDEHRLTVSLPVIRKIPDALRKDGFKVTATLARPVMDERQDRDHQRPARRHHRPQLCHRHGHRHHHGLRPADRS